MEIVICCGLGAAALLALWAAARRSAEGGDAAARRGPEDLRRELEGLRREVAALREEVASLREAPDRESAMSAAVQEGIENLMRYAAGRVPGVEAEVR